MTETSFSFVESLQKFEGIKQDLPPESTNAFLPRIESAMAIKSALTDRLGARLPSLLSRFKDDPWPPAGFSPLAMA